MPRKLFKDYANSGYRKEVEFDKRCVESLRIRQKFPDKVPIIAERAPRSSCVELEQRKFLVPNDINVMQLIYILRKRLKLTEAQALYIYPDSAIPPPTSMLISTLDAGNRDLDGFLYIHYDSENTFG